jgi:hypothetical protein
MISKMPVQSEWAPSGAKGIFDANGTPATRSLASNRPRWRAENIVKHVTVHEGGQAIVGAVTTRARTENSSWI